MIHNFLKRSISLMAVVLVLISTMVVPAFAINYTKTSTTCGGVCETVRNVYGNNVDYYEGSPDDCPYKVKIGSTDICLKERPDVNDVSVNIGADGTLNVLGMGNGDANTWNQFFAKYKAIIVGISGIGAITFIALFIFQFMKLGASAGNPQARSMALSGCLWTGIAAAALGAVSIIAGFFYNAV